MRFAAVESTDRRGAPNTVDRPKGRGYDNEKERRITLVRGSDTASNARLGGGADWGATAARGVVFLSRAREANALSEQLRISATVPNSARRQTTVNSRGERPP